MRLSLGDYEERENFTSYPHMKRQFARVFPMKNITVGKTVIRNFQWRK
nr:MAG TPA: hypothetical protein [Caudoviricetes sp.]